LTGSHTHDTPTPSTVDFGWFLTTIDHPVLTAAEQHALGRRIAAGRVAWASLGTATGAAERRRLRARIEAAEQAAWTLVTHNLRWLRSEIAGDRNAEDLFQEGVLELLRAARRFDPDREASFLTFAKRGVRHVLKRARWALRRSVDLPERLAKQDNRFMVAVDQLTQALGREPTDAEVAAVLGWRVDQVQGYRRWRDPHPAGLDADRDGAYTSAADDALVATDDSRAAAEAADRLLGLLGERERRVLALRHGIGTGEPCSVPETAARLGLPVEAVKQAEARALGILRHPATLAMTGAAALV